MRLLISGSYIVSSVCVSSRGIPRELKVQFGTLPAYFKGVFRPATDPKQRCYKSGTCMEPKSSPGRSASGALQPGPGKPANSWF